MPHQTEPATRKTDAWTHGPQYQESLQDLPADVRGALIELGVTRQLKAGDAIQRQGQKPNHVVVCLKGRLAVMVAGPSGHETLLRFVTEGELIGLPTVLANLPASTTVVASSACETLHISRADFVQVLSRFPQGGISVAVLLSHRLAELFRYVEMTAHRTLSDRVAYALRRLTRRNGESQKDGTTHLKITQAELATAAGASRQRVHLELKQLESQGLIGLGYGRVIVKTDRL